MLKIKKLTPPQIAALREAFPACIEAGIISTTNSIATFHDRDGMTRQWTWTPDLAREVIVNRLVATQVDGLAKVLAKLETRPDLVEVAA